MLTRPPELADRTLAAVLAQRWEQHATALTYEPVGFGAHHWRTHGVPSGDWFLTVHDLAAKRRDAQETTDDVFRRLTASFASSRALQDAGLDFVLAPVPTTAGQIVTRIDDRFTLAVHPFLPGRPAGPDGEFETTAERLAVLDLVLEVHRHTSAAAHIADPDDRTVPHAPEIPASIDALGEAWDTGPYGEPARALLDRHAEPLQRLVAAHERLADQVDQLRDRFVLTHGEPHAGNVLDVGGHLLLIDWDTAVLAVAERDLCVLDPGDRSIVSAYEHATGQAASPAALDRYRLWFDLSEIGQYLGELRGPHTDTADMAESWKNLQHFLRPAERWPSLVG